MTVPKGDRNKGTGRLRHSGKDDRSNRTRREHTHDLNRGKRVNDTEDKYKSRPHNRTDGNNRKY